MAGDGSEQRLALDDHEFSIVRKGYDPEEVKAFLADIEANVRKLEAWAERMNARLANAEEKNEAIDDVNEAMVAVFESKQRVLEQADRQAEAIRAEAIARARADAEIASSDVIAEADIEVRRILEAAHASTTPITEESILAAARTKADRLIDEARVEAERVVSGARVDARAWAYTEPLQPSTLSTPLPPIGTVGSESMSQLLVEMEEVEVELEGTLDREVLVDDRDDAEHIDLGDDGAEIKQSRYARTSAGLPSIGDGGAAAVLGSIGRMRKKIQES